MKAAANKALAAWCPLRFIPISFFKSDDSPGSIQYSTAMENREDAHMKEIESPLAMPVTALAVLLAACAATPPGPTAAVRAELAPTGTLRVAVFTGNSVLGSR